MLNTILIFIVYKTITMQINTNLALALTPPVS